MNRVFLAYCIENQTVASKIISAINGKSEVEKIIFDANTGIKTLAAKVRDNSTPIVLLVSDNFLKNESCMQDALVVLQNLATQKRLIPVTTEGVYAKNGNGEFYTVPTSFDRVSNVIQYMNYWQDSYLELRRARPSNVDEMAFNERVRVVRTISSEIGELLRFLRAIEYFSFENLEETRFAGLFRILGLPVPLEVEVKKADVSYTVFPDAKVEVKAEPIAEPIVQIVENEVIMPEPIAEKIDLSAIPGVNLLPNMEDIAAEKTFEAVPLTKNEGSISLENMVDDIKKEDRYALKEELPKTSNFNEVVDDILNEDAKIADQIVEAEQLSSKPDPEWDAADDDIHNIFDLESVPLVKNEVKNEAVEAVEVIEVSETIEKPIETGELSMENLEVPEIESKAEIAAESLVEMPLEVAEVIEVAESVEETTEEAILVEATETIEAHAAEMDLELADEPLHALVSADPVEEELKIKEEVSRIFNESEQVENAFDYEKNAIPVAQNVDNQNVIEMEQTLESTSPNAEVGSENTLESAHAMLSKNPLDNEARYNYSAALAQNNRYQDALEQLDILIENDRTNVEAYIFMAYVAEQTGDNLLSLNCLEKVTLLNPNYTGIFYKLGMLTNEHFKGQKRKAYRYFQEAIAREPKNADAHYQFARMDFEQNGNRETYMKHLEEAIELNPQHAEASFELAKMFYEVGEKEKAAAYYTHASVENPIYKTKINDDIFQFVAATPSVSDAVNDNGKVVLITGATSGIGRATAEIFAKNGYRLILTGRREDRLKELVSEFSESFRNKNQILTFDVRNLDEVKKAVETIGEEFENVDILINNAGLASGLAPIHEGDINDWDVMIDTNIKGLLYMTRAISPRMVERKSGHIINICSIAGKEIYPNGNVYMASKHAVDALTKAMRADLYTYNIRVGQVAPGHVEETEFALVRFHGDAEKAKIYQDFQPLKASDVAETIYFMASRPAYVNIQDVLLMGTQQANVYLLDRSGRKE